MSRIRFKKGNPGTCARSIHKHDILSTLNKQALRCNRYSYIHLNPQYVPHFRYLSSPSNPVSPDNYHLSQLSSSNFPFPPGPPIPPPPLLFLIALVPTALCLCAPASAKLSQKSFLLSSSGILLYAPPLLEPPFPSTKRLKPSAAFLAPVCAPRATWAAAKRAWAATSLSAI